MELGRVSHQSKTQAVEEQLRAKIASGEIQPGERLRQDLIAEQMGVSSTPVREALRRLEAEGLVLHIPNKGVTASQTTRPQIREVFPLRIMLEGYATRLAASKLSKKELDFLTELHHTMVDLQKAGDLRTFSAVNDRWHSTIYRAAGSKLLEKTIVDIWKTASVDDLWTIPGRSAASVVEHERILRALCRHDPEGAEQAMGDHHRSGERFLLDFIGAKPASDER